MTEAKQQELAGSQCKPTTSSNAPSNWRAKSSSVEEIRKALRKEGYSNVDAHLEGASIKADLKKRFAR